MLASWKHQSLALSRSPAGGSHFDTGHSGSDADENITFSAGEKARVAHCHELLAHASLCFFLLLLSAFDRSSISVQEDRSDGLPIGQEQHSTQH